MRFKLFWDYKVATTLRIFAAKNHFSVVADASQLYLDERLTNKPDKYNNQLLLKTALVMQT